MALAKAEWKRRLEAILTLKGMDLADLRDAMEGRGLPKNAAARAGHESDTYVPNDALAMVVADLLDVPVDWFQADDWRPLLRGSLEEAAAEAPVTQADFEAFQIEQAEGFARVRREIAAVRMLLDHGEEGQAGGRRGG